MDQFRFIFLNLVSAMKKFCYTFSQLDAIILVLVILIKISPHAI